MPEVGLGETVNSVRAKVGLGDTDLLNAWRTVNVRARSFGRRFPLLHLYHRQKPERLVVG